jgi:plastocyanin
MFRELHTSNRRDVMKIIGAGTVLSALGGSAIAQETGETESQPGTGSVSETTVHQVRTLISVPPTNPNRPADFFYQPTGIHVQPGDVIQFVFQTPDHNVVGYHPAFGMRRRVPTGVEAFSSPLLGWHPDSIDDDQIEPPSEMGGGEGEDGDDGTTAGASSGVDEGDDVGEGDGASEGDSDDAKPVPDDWLYLFEKPGVYDILCSPHESFGMVMRVVVGDVTEASFETSDPAKLPEPRRGPAGLARVTLTDPALEPAAIVRDGTVKWESLQANQTSGSSQR